MLNSRRFTFAALLMSKKAFISRDLDDSSEFAHRLKSAGWAVQGCSLVTLRPLPITEIPDADWLFFASGNAVRFFFAGLKSPSPYFSIEAEARVSWAALGPATARELMKHTGRVDFTGTGDPATTAALFRPLAAGRSVLFPAARHSRQSVPKALGDAIEALHLAVYDNAPVSDPPPIDADVLVFTSPMNAEAYFARHPLQPHQRVIAIGKTTADALMALGIPGVRLAADPSESALAEAVLFPGQ